MAINFPDSPSLNDTHSVGSLSWTWDGSKWTINSSAGAGGGGGGAVDSVNSQTGTVVLDADDIDDTSTTHKFATAAQLSAADSAVQPGDLATVATTGAYSDLSGTPALATVATSGAYGDLSGTPTLATVATTGAYGDLTGTPTLGTAAATASTDYATSAQGALADSATQPGDLASVATTGTFASLSDKTITVCDETVFNLTGTALNGTNGPIQYKTLGSNVTFTNSMSEGESITLMLADGSAFTATWPTMTWVGGSAPTLPTSGFAVIELWVVNGTLYGVHAGDA